MTNFLIAHKHRSSFGRLRQPNNACMSYTELAANLFRATQAEEKLRRDGVHGKQQANKTHFEVGQKVRETIRDLGGTMPENLPTPEQGIKQIESTRQKIGKKKQP